MSKYEEALIDVSNVNINHMTPNMYLGIHKKVVVTALKIADMLNNYPLDQLEALANGEAWISRWEDSSEHNMNKILQHYKYPSGAEGVVFHRHIVEKDEATMHYMTFNGNSSIPEPKGE